MCYRRVVTIDIKLREFDTSRRIKISKRVDDFRCVRS